MLSEELIFAVFANVMLIDNLVRPLFFVITRLVEQLPFASIVNYGSMRHVALEAITGVWEHLQVCYYLGMKYFEPCD